MKILVTGGAGFIGKYLTRHLLEKGHSVTIFDNFSNSSKDSLIGILNGATLIEGDITSQQEIVSAAKDHDVVIHLAAKISVDESIKNPAATFRVNVDGTRNVLVACEKNQVKKLVVASSAAVYGDSLPNTKLAENSQTNPISPYGESKVLMEQEIKDFAVKHNINYVIMRFFNIYGIGQSPEYAGVITKFIEKISRNESLEIFGDGTQTRDFVAVQDVVDAIYAAVNNANSNTYNIGSGKITTVKDLAKIIISLSGKSLAIKYHNAKKGDIKHSVADITLANKDLGFFPKHDLSEIKNLLNL